MCCSNVYNVNEPEHAISDQFIVPCSNLHKYCVVDNEIFQTYAVF